MNEPKVIQVIESHVPRGCGVTFCSEAHRHESIRTVTQYHTLSGEFLAERDPVTALNKQAITVGVDVRGNRA